MEGVINILKEKIRVMMVDGAPNALEWQGRWKVDKIGLHHYYREGRRLIHVFGVISGNLFFRISFDTDDLSWTLEEVSDGNAC